MQPGVDVQRAAAGGLPRVGEGDAGAGRAEDSDDGGVDVTLPGVHDAAGEQPDVVSGGAQRRFPERHVGDAESLRDQPSPLGDGDQA